MEKEITEKDLEDMDRKKRALEMERRHTRIETEIILAKHSILVRQIFMLCDAVNDVLESLKKYDPDEAARIKSLLDNVGFDAEKDPDEWGRDITYSRLVDLRKDLAKVGV